jgi:hypothetical protein
VVVPWAQWPVACASRVVARWRAGGGGSGGRLCSGSCWVRVEQVERPPIDESRQQLLGVSENQGVSEDLLLGVERAQAGDELPANGDQGT